MAHHKLFSNNWAIILGGSSGFGLSAVQKLSEGGMNIAVVYRETAAGERTTRDTLDRISADYGVSVLSYNMNALDEAARMGFIRAFSEKVSGAPVVRLMLHSIARGNLKPLAGSRDEPMLSGDDIALTTYAMSASLLDWVRDVFQAGLFLSGASIIGLTSEGAHRYWEGYGAVSMAKSSLESLAAYMAVEFGKLGLRTNLIQAGITATPSLMRIPGSDRLLEIAAGRNPLGRATTPQDVANAIYLLCLEEASWINGALLHVDGGEHCL